MVLRATTQGTMECLARPRAVWSVGTRRKSMSESGSKRTRKTVNFITMKRGFDDRRVGLKILMKPSAS